MERVRALFLAVAVLGSLAVGQTPPFIPGDLILSDLGNADTVVYLDKAMGTLTTLMPSVTPAYINWVTMAADNVNILALLSGATDALLRIDPALRVTTLAIIPGTGSPNAIDLMQDGRYVISSSDNFLRVMTGTTIQTLAGPPKIAATLNNVAFNHDRGNLVLGIFGTGTVEFFDLVTGLATTVYSGLGRVSSVDPMPRGWKGQEAFAVTTFDAPEVRICSGGKVVATWGFVGANAVKVDDATGNLYVTGPRAVTEYTPQGTAVKTWGPFSGFSFTGVDVYASKPVSGSGSAKGGTKYTFTFSFMSGGNNPYVAALSLSQRPGISLPGGGVLNLAPDTLFYLTLSGLFPGNIGFLQGGKATWTVPIPAGLPPGLTFYCAAVVFFGPTPVPGNTVGVTIRP